MPDLNGYAYANEQKVPLKTQGNSILVQTEEGLVAVSIEEFDVVMVDGQVMLLAEENPLLLAMVYYGFTGAMAGAAGAAGLKVCGFAIGKKGAAALMGTGGALGAAYAADKYGAW